MRNSVSNMATIILTICALVITGLVLRREFFPATAVAVPLAQYVENWEDIASKGHLIGPENAPVKIVEFSDFQCPFCANSQQTLRELQQIYPERVAIIYRHFPLEEIHPHAFSAALAAECAASQGSFEAYHDELFAMQNSIGILTWLDFAEAAGVSDLRSFRSCVEDSRFRGRVEGDIEAGENAGVSSTPTFVVNGQIFSGDIPIHEWEERVQTTLAASGKD